MDVVDSQLDILKKELDLIDTAIRQIDDITKGIKNWAIVTWTAALGLALATSELKPYLWLTAIIPLLFWIVDASYRRVQRSFILRNREISNYVNTDCFRSAIRDRTSLDLPLLKLRTRSTDWKNTIFGVMVFRTVGLLYIGLVSISVVTWAILNKIVGS